MRTHANDIEIDRVVDSISKIPRAPYTEAGKNACTKNYYEEQKRNSLHSSN